MSNKIISAIPSSLNLGNGHAYLPEGSNDSFFRQSIVLNTMINVNIEGPNVEKVISGGQQDELRRLLCEIRAKGGLPIERCEQIQKQLGFRI